MSKAKGSRMGLKKKMASLQNAKFAKANSFSGSTTSLTKHLDKIHQVEYTRAAADKALEM